MKLKTFTRIALTIFSFYHITYAYADEAVAPAAPSAQESAQPGHHHHHWKKFHEAMQACLAKDGITLPKPQPGVRPDFGVNKAAVDSCRMQVKANFEQQHAAHRAAMQACLAKDGITLPKFTPGVKPNFDDKTKAALKACHQELKASEQSSQSQQTAEK